MTFESSPGRQPMYVEINVESENQFEMQNSHENILFIGIKYKISVFKSYYKWVKMKPIVIHNTYHTIHLIVFSNVIFNEEWQYRLKNVKF